MVIELKHTENTKLFLGRDNGEWYRLVYDLDRLDLSGEQVEVHIPEDTFAVTSSFFGGMFDESIRLLGPLGFKHQYNFTGLDIWLTVDHFIGEQRNV